MSLFRELQRWIDRDFERHDYVPDRALGQKLLFLLPMLVLGVVDLVVEIPPGSAAYHWSFAIAGTLCLTIGVFQAWRWIVGYARPSWHEEQVRKRQEKERS